MNGIRKRLLRFYTDGENIVRDFSAARARKDRSLRRAANLCFYIHCAAALACAVSAAVSLGLCLNAALIIAAAAITSLLAFLTLVRKPAAKIILYIADLAAAVFCAAAGGVSGMAVYFLCCSVMIFAALSSLAGFFISCCRRFLADFDPEELTPECYTVIRPRFGGTAEPEPKPEPQPFIPPAPAKSDMELLAEQLAAVLNPKPAEPPEQEENSKTEKRETADAT